MILPIIHQQFQVPENAGMRFDVSDMYGLRKGVHTPISKTALQGRVQYTSRFRYIKMLSNYTLGSVTLQSHIRKHYRTYNKKVVSWNSS